MRFSEFQEQVQAFEAIPREKRAAILAVAKDLGEDRLDDLLKRVAALQEEFVSNEKEYAELLAKGKQMMRDAERAFAKGQRVRDEEKDDIADKQNLDSLFNDA